MKRCWLHIGMHKTGTTSVQRTLASIANPKGWAYITVGGPNMGRALYAMFATQPHDYYWFKQRGETPDQIARNGAILRLKLAKAIEECSQENFIISSETLSNIDAQGISKLHSFLKPLCDEVRVIGYVRPPVGFKISFFQQRLKFRRVAFDLGKLRLKYSERFRKFDEVFGEAKVLLREFDPESFKNRCVVQDLCEQIGIGALPSEAVVRMNESLCREACGILYAYRKYGAPIEIGKDALKASKQLVSPFLAMGGTKFRVSKSLVMAGLAKESKDLEWMEKRLGKSLREEIAEDGSEVQSEDDLLRIERSSCLEFAARFREICGLSLPDEMIPNDSPVDPRQVAELVAYCHSLCLARIRKVPFLLRVWKYFKKIATVNPGR